MVTTKLPLKDLEKENHTLLYHHLIKELTSHKEYYTRLYKKPKLSMDNIKTHRYTVY